MVLRGSVGVCIYVTSCDAKPNQVEPGPHSLGVTAVCIAGSWNSI